jgi:hypothetical protein
MAPKARAVAKAKANPILHNTDGRLRHAVTKQLKGLKRMPLWLRNFDKNVKSVDPFTEILHCGTSQLGGLVALQVSEYLLTLIADERGRYLDLLQLWRPQILRKVSRCMQTLQIRSRAHIRRVVGRITVIEGRRHGRGSARHTVCRSKLIVTAGGIIMS